MIGSLYTNMDIEKLLRGLAIGATALPGGEFRNGYETALVAVGTAFGMEFARPTNPQLPAPVVRSDWEGLDSGIFAWAGGS